MSRIPNQPYILAPLHPSVNKSLRDSWQLLTQVLNGGISLGGPNDNLGNVDNTHFNGVVPTANTDFIVTHNLGRIPTGFIVVSKTLSGDVWKGATAWTKTQLSIQSSVANQNLTLLIY